MDETDIKRIELLTLDVKPGQVLVVDLDRHPSQRDMDALQSGLKKALPEVPVLFTFGGIHFTVIDAPAA